MKDECSFLRIGLDAVAAERSTLYSRVRSALGCALDENKAVPSDFYLYISIAFSYIIVVFPCPSRTVRSLLFVVGICGVQAHGSPYCRGKVADISNADVVPSRSGQWSLHVSFGYV